MRELRGLLSDFDFTTPGDESRAIAAFLAPALRFGGWLSCPLPIDVGEADASQSGKTYRQKLVAAIYREIPNIVVQRSGGVGGFDEGLSQKLIDGCPFVLIDNLRGRLDSAFLEAILTAPGTVPARVPHRGEIAVDPKGFAFQLTSNGVETTRDLANRASIIRIKKRVTGYEFRTYVEGDVYAHVIANQPKLLGCVFAVITKWVEAGCPRTRDTRHDFREWAQTMDWIVQNVFEAAPLMEGQEGARDRISDPARSWLRNVCLTVRSSGQSNVHSATSLAEFCAEYDILPPGLKTESAIDVAARRIGGIMKRLFGDSNKLDLDGYAVSRGTRYSPKAQKEVPEYYFGDVQRELPLGSGSLPKADEYRPQQTQSGGLSQSAQAQPSTSSRPEQVDPGAPPTAETAKGIIY